MKSDIVDDYALTKEDAVSIIKKTSFSKFEISHGHDKTEEFIRKYELTTDDVIEIIKSITISDYVKGPEPDDKPGPRRNKPIWVFKKMWKLKYLYIKLKIFITKNKTYVVSIHIDE